MRKLFQKKKFKKLFVVSAIIIAFLCINAFSMKGFYNTLNYPGATWGFINKGYCFSEDIPGGKYPDDGGRSYIEAPQNMDDYDKCGNTYASVLWTFVTINRGQWIGVHIGSCLIMVETRWREDEAYTKYSKRLGFPYYILWYHGRKDGFTKFEQELYNRQLEDIRERREKE